MITGVYVLFLKWILLLIGVVTLALGTWELRIGENKRKFLVLITLGAFLIVVSQVFLQIIGLFSIGAFR